MYLGALESVDLLELAFQIGHKPSFVFVSPFPLLKTFLKGVLQAVVIDIVTAPFFVKGTLLAFGLGCDRRTQQ
jgi:hypothetical protein